MTALQALLYGILQGIAEFLPISSSGHLVVMQAVFGINQPMLVFDVILHVGSLFAIAIIFWQDILELLKNPLSKPARLLVVGTLPAIIAGLFFRNFIEGLRTGIWLAVAFTVTGVLLILADSIRSASKADITYKDALIIGVFQAFALPPGISRSGATITGGLACGIKREAAARFSFMLALIAIAGAGLLEAIGLARGGNGLNDISAYLILIGLISSFTVGYASIKLLLKLISKCRLRIFSYYVWGLAALILVDYFIFNNFF